MDWFVAEFGEERLFGEVVLPTDDYFPGVYQGSRDDVRAKPQQAKHAEPDTSQSTAGGASVG